MFENTFVAFTLASTLFDIQCHIIRSFISIFQHYILRRITYSKYD